MITIISFGKAKNSIYQPAQDEFLKRLGNKIKLVEIESFQAKTAKEILNKEEKMLAQYFSTNSYNILLDIKGREFTSEEFSQKLMNLNATHKNINFFIGSSYGFSKNIKEKANLLLSFGKITLPHLLARITLLEQLFRAFAIDKRHPYHK